MTFRSFSSPPKTTSLSPAFVQGAVLPPAYPVDRSKKPETITPQPGPEWRIGTARGIAVTVCMAPMAQV